MYLVQQGCTRAQAPPAYLKPDLTLPSTAMSAKVTDSVVLDEKEKVSIEQRSPAASLDAPDDDSELLAPEVRQTAERHLVRVLDSRLMPTIIIIFLMNYIDVRLVALYVEIVLIRVS